MRAAELPDALTSALDELAGLADESDTALLTALRERLRAARLRVLVVGEAKRGKSTLVNALLGREVLPTGVTPLTAVPTTVTHGTGEAMEVAFAGGRTAHRPLSALEEFGTERGNPGNSRGVAAITVSLDSPILARGVEIVDTPGTGSVHAHNTAAADGVLPTMDAAIFVLTADPPVSAAERDLLERVHELSVTTFVVLNKADYADAAGLAEAVEFTERIAGQAVGGPVRAYPVSARAALSAAGDVGFAAFAADFGAYLDNGRTADLRRSAAGQLRRVAGAGIDEIALARRAAEMRSSDAAERVTAFTARLAAVDSLLGGELAVASPGEIEQQGRARLARLAVDGAESWRQAQRERLEDGLTALDDRLSRDLAAELGAVREAAAELLGLKLTAPGPQERLAPDRRFFYSVAEGVDQAELLAGAIRRRLPGELGRRLARDHVLGEVRDQAVRQIGRARSDLQYRLAEATRQLVLAVGRRYSGGTDRLARALRTAAALREQTAGQAEGRLAELGARERALRGVLARLEHLERLDGGDDGQDDR